MSAPRRSCRSVDQILPKHGRRVRGCRFNSSATNGLMNCNVFSAKRSSFDVHLLLDLTDLELAMRRVPCGKARDLMACRESSYGINLRALRASFIPQLVKMILHGQEHIGFKGGMLQPACKGRGPMDSCHSYRSLLISIHLGKVLHRTIRTKQSILYERFMQQEQTGGRTKVPVQLALHQLRAFARQAKQKNLSAGHCLPGLDGGLLYSHARGHIGRHTDR